jgi:hypothetical protein
VEREQRHIASGLQSFALYAGLAVARGEGCSLIDEDGNEYIDFVAGIGIGSVGHCHPHYVASLQRQLERVTFGSFTTEARARFLERLATLTPPGLTRIQLFSGGAEAVEAALRLARAATGKHEVLGFWGGFHGKTGGVLGLLGSPFKHHLGPFLPGQHVSPYADCYRCPLRLQYPGCGIACAEYLRDVIRHQTGGEISAVIAGIAGIGDGEVAHPGATLPRASRAILQIDGRSERADVRARCIVASPGDLQAVEATEHRLGGGVKLGPRARLPPRASRSYAAGRGGDRVTVIERLNELLEAERAGVEALSRLFPEARGPGMHTLFEAVRDDEAWSCAGLVRSIKALGGPVSDRKGDFADKVMAEPTLAARLRLLNRGQGWVVKRLDGLLGESLPVPVVDFLEEMKARHLANIEACERLAHSAGAA